MILACVFKESKTFTSDYVKVFSNVFHHYHPEYKQVCFTDYAKPDLPKRIERIPLKYDFDTWFSKMELFRTDIGEDIFYSDLDNIIIKPLTNFFEFHINHPHTPFLINDVDLNQKRFQTAVMYIPASQKIHVWNSFIKNPTNAILSANKFGDAKIIRESIGHNSKTYQENFHKNCVVSYRLGWLKGIQNNVQIVCQHGEKEKPLNTRFIDNPLIKNHFLRWKY